MTSPVQKLHNDSQTHAGQFTAIADGSHNNPFAVLGVHKIDGARIVRAFQPRAAKVTLIDRSGKVLEQMQRVHQSGIFTALLPPRIKHYRLRIHCGDGKSFDIEDTYRFPSTLGDLDLYYFGEGSHDEIYTAMGAHPTTAVGVKGTRFAVWAPNASRVSVVGDFNDWDGRRHIMRVHPGNGIWEIFVPGVGDGSHYKYEIVDRDGKLLPLKTDPYGSFFEAPPGNASIVFSSAYQWQDSQYIQQRDPADILQRPVSIYEVHLGSWRRDGEQGERSKSYRALADELIAYVSDMAFTHIELLPITEHPFDGSWGYQPIGMYAPTQRFGDPDDLRYLIDRCHESGISVIVDWVPAHFPKDEHGLARFDGSALYEHEDPRKGEHADWGTLIFNYGRREVLNYLIGSALYWINEFHVDALRVDAVASMLYLDYSREDGQWLPNEFGGNENLEAVAFLRRLNEAVHTAGGATFAEESTAWPGVSHPTYAGGLGFTFKWNMGWMNDTLSYIQEQPIHRKYHHDKMTFGLVYAFNENFVLPLSHDEVVHGKRSILGRMPGDEWQKFANLRAYYGFMFGHPGKKLLFMGAEFAQSAEWNHDQSLDWHLLQYAPHQGIQALIRSLNRVYRESPALYEVDFEHSGFEWLNFEDRDNCIFSWLRRANNGEFVVCVTNFTPVVRHDYRIGVPEAGNYVELLNTDAAEFGGSGTLNDQPLRTITQQWDGREHSLQLTVPPLATLMLQPVARTAKST